MSKRKILVTGSNGLLGQKLVKQLKASSKFELIATSRGENRISDTEGYQYLAMDIANEGEVDRVFNEIKPDVVINTAAMTNVDACENDKENCWLLNVKAVEYLIKASEKYQSHLIHLSTDFVFDGKNGPYKEEDEPNPVSYYGKSKLEAEKLVQQAKTKWAIARTIIV